MRLLKWIFTNQSKNQSQNKKIHTEELLKNIFKANDIDVKEIRSAYTFAAGDYSDTLFQKIKNDIEVGNAIDRGAEKLSWNRPHLHFHLVISNNLRLFVFAVVYPFEISDSVKVLWLKELDKDINDKYIQQCMTHKII